MTQITVKTLEAVSQTVADCSNKFKQWDEAPITAEPPVIDEPVTLTEYPSWGGSAYRGLNHEFGLTSKASWVRIKNGACWVTHKMQDKSGRMWTRSYKAVVDDFGNLVEARQC